jgi:hypothetical protein
MTDRYDAVAARKYEQNGEEKTAFTNIGVAFKMKERDGFSLRLHCLPAPVDGEYSILLFPPKPREDDAPRREPERRQGYSADKTRRHVAPAFESTGMDDDIPF